MHDSDCILFCYTIFRKDRRMNLKVVSMIRGFEFPSWILFPQYIWSCGVFISQERQEWEKLFGISMETSDGDYESPPPKEKKS